MMSPTNPTEQVVAYQASYLGANNGSNGSYFPLGSGYPNLSTYSSYGS